jgi:Uma2 family endonuclease
MTRRLPIPKGTPMSVASPPLVESRSIADLLEELGDIPASRVRLYPYPGTATEKDVIEIEARENRLYELVEGVLVEKAMGYRESLLAALLIHFLTEFALRHDLGIVAGADGTIQLAFKLVRIPDVAFVSWARLPNGEIPAEPIPALAPDLAIEVLSEGNTKREMERKLREYFAAGVRLVWYVEPKARAVRVYTAPDQETRLDESQTLDGGAVLPGFALPLGPFFELANRRQGG